jgi:hypothetical protein
MYVFKLQMKWVNFLTKLVRTHCYWSEEDEHGDEARDEDEGDEDEDEAMRWRLR